MHTPRGIFELKYFFSSHVSTAAGGECSSTAIRALIKKLVAAENPRKPLSDNKITSIIRGTGNQCGPAYHRQVQGNLNDSALKRTQEVGLVDDQLERTKRTAAC